MTTTRLKSSLLVFLILWVAGCAPPSKEQIGATLDEAGVVETMVAESSPSVPAANLKLTMEALMDHTFFAPFFGQAVSLKDGEYRFIDGSRVFLMPQVAFGDLNNDQEPDAAVLLAEETAEHEIFVSLVVLIFENDEFNQTNALLIGKGAEVSSIEIAHGAITLNALMRNTADDINLPERNVWQTYQYMGGTLVLTKISSSIRQGSFRTIEISSPVDGDQVGASVFIEGSMPVSPFENNLRFAVYDLEGQLLSQSGFMVEAEDMGAPAVFNNEVDLPSLPSGTRVRLELADLSMADGSLIAMNSVWVTIE